jgi:hypothetical protein
VLPVADRSAAAGTGDDGAAAARAGRLFYEFRLEDRVPENHLLRRLNVFVTAALADLHKELKPITAT